MYKCDVRIDAENTAGRQGHMINNDQSKKSVLFTTDSCV